jgi:hypothetical protein
MATVHPVNTRWHPNHGPNRKARLRRLRERLAVEQDPAVRRSIQAQLAYLEFGQAPLTIRQDSSSS